MTLHNPLPEEAITAILDHCGEAMLVGAHARDHIVTTHAHLTGGRTTSDLYLAIAVPSINSFKASTKTLDKHGDTGMGFHIEHIHVDLIPFAPDGNLGPTVEVAEGIQMDITGMDEAFRTAERMRHPYKGLRVPTLQAMIVLKTVAWNMRKQQVNKDAQDLELLLRCVNEGIYEDRCYGKELERLDGDPRRVGAYLTGADAARDLPRATAVCRHVWNDPELAHAMLPQPSSRRILDDLTQQLKDLIAGSRRDEP